MVKEGDGKLEKIKNRTCLWFVVSTVYPKALFSHFRDKQFLKSQCQLFISSGGEYGAQVKNTLGPKFQFPNWLFSCSLVTTSQICTFTAFSQWSDGHNRLLCSPVWETLCFSLTNALPVLDAQHMNFILSDFKKGNVIFQYSYTVTVLCLLSYCRLSHFWKTVYSGSNLCRHIPWF